MATPDTTVYDDPFEAATHAKAPVAEYFGELFLDTWFCVFEKGVGKRPFDNLSDDLSRRAVAVDMQVNPLPETNLKFNLERKLVADSIAWANITWPSLKQFGLHMANEANNRYVRVRLVPAGRTYIGKDGSKKEETTFEFLALYADENACREAYLNRNVRKQPAAAPAKTSQPAQTSQPVQTAAPTQPAQQSGEDAARKTALTFAKAIVTNLARQYTDFEVLQTKIAEKLATMPMVNKYYTIDSPEVMQLIAEAITN